MHECLSIDQPTKKKNCFELLGSLADEGRYFDDILIEILSSIAKNDQHEDVLAKVTPIVYEALLLPLSEESLLQIL